MKKGSKAGAKGGEEEEPTDKKQENLGEKLRKVVGKRGGQFTPVLPFPAHISGSGGAQDSSLVAEEKNPSLSWASARKLGASVWELQHYNLPLAKMHRGGGGGGGRNHRHHHHRRHHLLEDSPDPSPASPDLGSASSLRRHVAASLMQHHRNRHAIQPVSPASYGGSSMEVAHYNPVATPTSSIELKAGTGETSYSLKTSTELLKVLNRIWSLEEQHAANVSLVRALKAELDSSRAKIKELVRDRQSDRHEMDLLLKQIAQDKLGQVNAAVQSVRDELEDERKLRKRSETLHRKLARELYESKTMLTNALRDLEKERESRKLLEDLCDEFALGIKTYEQEMQSFKQTKSEKGTGSNYRSDRDGLILHISESWLDERMQTKQEMTPPNSSIVEKLSSEIEAFLEAKRNSTPKQGPGPGSGSRVGTAPRRRHSLESIPLNLAASAPHDDGDEDEASSAGSDSHCFELDKPVVLGKDNIVNSTKKKLASQEAGKGRDAVKFEEQMARAILRQDETKTGTNPEDENQVEITEEGGYERPSKSTETRKVSNSKYMESLIRNHFSHPGNDYTDSAAKALWKSHPSPVREWTTKLPTDDLEISESSTKIPPESKEQNTLKSKLQEARTRGQKSRSRLKANKVSI